MAKKNDRLPPDQEDIGHDDAGQATGDVEASKLNIPDVLPVIPIRDLVLFPYMIFPLFIGRETTIQAVEEVLSGDEVNKHILLLTQKDATEEEPSEDDLYRTGTVATIMRMLKMPDGKIKVLVQGLARVRVDEFTSFDPYIEARVTRLEQPFSDDDAVEEPVHEKVALEREALLKNVRSELEKASEYGKNLPAEILLFINNIDEPGRLADIVMAHLDADLETCQSILETVDPHDRLLGVLAALTKENEMLKLQQQIMSQAKGEIDKTQRDYMLRQQLKAIKQELGEEDDRQEIEELREKIATLKAPKQVRETAQKQLRRLESMHPESAESGVVRTYLDTLLSLPWSKSSRERVDLRKAKEQLDADHFGLEQVKDRILEYLAVRKLKKNHKGPILCFVGPPGVGKTSLGRSVAESLGRKFHRISLGGVRDEAEIRGHRRTYVGAMPGRILQGMRQVGTNNPVIMLDEVDKLGADFRGDPSAALLEVLDPEQNNEFTDHYLEVPFDLSKVLFIATANMLDPIHPAFLDRMEVITIPGYTLEEKRTIARQYLIPRQIENNGLKKTQLIIDETGLEAMITRYTREAGLRNLERQIGKVARKVARKVAEDNGKGDAGTLTLSEANIQEYLGAPVFIEEEELLTNQVGVVRGLAVTSVGGDVLNVEATKMPGKGNLILTGSLGDVMKESAKAGMSFIRSRGEILDILPDTFEKTDLHVHVPEGATPKDGPSAGITITTALLSRLLDIPVPGTIAMTGEITLTGRVLRIGGVKQKFLAAKRYGATKVLLPKANQPDYAELEDDYKEGVEVVFVDTMDAVVEAVFGRSFAVA